MIGGGPFLHYCSQCGHEIPHREKFCQSCGTKVEYLCALPPMPLEPARRREVRSAASITKWIIIYVTGVLFMFGFSYLYFSSPGLFSWPWSLNKQPQAAAPQTPAPAAPARNENPNLTLKNAFNQLSINVQKTVSLVDDSRKVNVAGDPKRTADNYRVIQRSSDSLLAQLMMPPDASPEVGAVIIPLKECLSLLSKATSIMADYLEGKLSLTPPNPDWVGRSQEFSAQSQARLKEAQQALANLRKKIE
jgi:hypothetical protein